MEKGFYKILPTLLPGFRRSQLLFS